MRISDCAIMAQREQCTRGMKNKMNPTYTSETARLALELAEAAVDALELECSRSGRPVPLAARLRTNIETLKMQAAS